MTAPIVIVGAGQAGLQAAEALRSLGYQDDIVLVGDEEAAPYQRPPLSKQALLGTMSEDQLHFRTSEFYERQRIDLRTGIRIGGLDRQARRLTVNDGSTIDYEGLVIATGSRVRVPILPGIDLGGVHYLRSVADCRHLRAALDQASRVVVVGGGFIGLEVAATARKLGRPVVVIEALDRLMARAVSPFISDCFARLHRDHGAQLLFGSGVAALLGEHGKVTGVATTDGTLHPADLVVFGIGVIPNDELAAGAGLACERGIIVDACARTDDPRVTAAGDCTARRTGSGALVRLESVQNAIEQGKSAAAALMGQEAPFVAAPWFWSHQYDVMLQMVGLSAGHDQTVIRGSEADLKCSAFYFRDGRLIAVDSIRRPQDHMVSKRLLDKGRSPTPEQVADESFDLKSLLA